MMNQTSWLMLKILLVRVILIRSKLGGFVTPAGVRDVPQVDGVAGLVGVVLLVTGDGI